MVSSLVRNLVILLFASLATACSMQGMIEAMTSEEDRAFAQSFVDNIQAGDSAALQEMVDPELWKESAGQLEQAATLFPDGDSETQIIAYSMNSDGLGEFARTEREFTLVTTDQTHWTTTRLKTFQEGSDPLIISWNVDGSSERPADMEMMENVGTVFMWAGIIALLIFVGIIVLIVWLVRRSRRNANNNGRDAGIS